MYKTMESIYILLFTYMLVKNTELKNLCNTHKPQDQSLGIKEIQLLC